MSFFLSIIQPCSFSLSSSFIYVPAKPSKTSHNRTLSRPAGGRKLAKEIGCKFIETSSGLDHNVDELLVGIVAQVKLNPQRIRNLTDKQRANLCMTMQTKFKGPNDHLTELRRNEKNKSNSKKHSDTDDTTEASTAASRGAGQSRRRNIANKENLVEDSLENESDDERSSGDGEESDIEKYFNFDEKATVIASKDTSVNASSTTNSSTLNNFTKLLKSRRHATPGMSSINPLYNNSHLNLSSSSCSTPTSVYPSSSVSASHHQQQQQQQSTSSSFFGSSKANKRDLTNFDGNVNASQPTTPKKSNNSQNNDAESDGSDRCINRLSARTKHFLTSFLKFKRSLRVKRRNSNSCSDLFVI